MCHCHWIYTDKETEARNSKIESGSSEMQLEWQQRHAAKLFLKKVHPAGEQPSHWNNMISLLRSLNFDTVSRCATIGCQRTYLPSTHVMYPSLLPLPYTVEEEATTTWDINTWYVCKDNGIIWLDVDLEQQHRMLRGNPSNINQLVWRWSSFRYQSKWTLGFSILDKVFWRQNYQYAGQVLSQRTNRSI